MNVSTPTQADYNNELPNQPWSAKCPCGKRFGQPNAYALHLKSCSGFKKRLGRNLEEARQRHHGAPSRSSEVQPSWATTEESGPYLKKRRIRPAWLAASEDAEVDLVMSSSTDTTAFQDVSSRIYDVHTVLTVNLP